MSDIGNGRAGRADVGIEGGGSAGGVLGSRLSEVKAALSCCLRRARPMASMAIRTTCGTPRTCRPTECMNGATPSAVELRPRRSWPRAARRSAAARPRLPIEPQAGAPRAAAPVAAFEDAA
jgi:choline dehydrogenase-like flavoprotein